MKITVKYISDCISHFDTSLSYYVCSNFSIYKKISYAKQFIFPINGETYKEYLKCKKIDDSREDKISLCNYGSINNQSWVIRYNNFTKGKTTYKNLIEALEIIERIINERKNYK